MSQTDNLIISEWRIPSATSIGALQIKAWLPSQNPRLIFQIVHGMAEHMERYDAFARYLASQDIAVVSCDLPGHGRSAPDDRHLGFAAEQDGWRKVIQDLRSVTEQITARYPDLPVVLFGHSLGSFLARQYCSEYGETLTAVILSGTMGRNPLMPIARLIAAASIRFRGHLYRDTFIDKIMHLLFLRRIKAPVSQNDWISLDPSVVKAYDADPFCGFPFTASGYRDLFDLVIAISDEKWASQVPASLPIRLISGEQDPVGDFGQGVRYVNDLLVKTGHQDVQLILYPSCRHEILNEPNKHAVYQDISSYLLPWMLEGGQA